MFKTTINIYSHFYFWEIWGKQIIFINVSKSEAASHTHTHKNTPKQNQKKYLSSPVGDNICYRIL